MSRNLIKFKAASFSGHVDKENRVIKGVSLIQADREALGHEMFIDEKMVRQVVKQGKETGDVGLKARVDHPSSCFSSMGSQLGRFKNFKKSGNKAVADLHISDFTKHAPGGDMGKWLLAVAEEDPDQLGFSIVFEQAEAEEFSAGEDDDPDDICFNLPHARLGKLFGADIVDEAAANDGMFSIQGRPDYLKEQVTYWAEENPEMLNQILAPALEVYYKSQAGEAYEDFLKITKELKDNTNQKSIQMSDEKTSLSEASQEDIDAAVVGKIEPTKVSTDTEEIEALSAAKDLALEEAVAKNKELTKGSEDMAAQLKEALSAIEGLTAKVAELSKESIGDTVDAISDTAEQITEEASVEVKAEQRSQAIREAAHEQANGNSIVQTYVNSLNKK